MISGGLHRAVAGDALPDGEWKESLPLHLFFFSSLKNSRKDLKSKEKKKVYL